MGEGIRPRGRLAHYRLCAWTGTTARWSPRASQERPQSRARRGSSDGVESSSSCSETNVLCDRASPQHSRDRLEPLQDCIGHKRELRGWRSEGQDERQDVSHRCCAIVAHAIPTDRGGTARERECRPADIFRPVRYRVAKQQDISGTLNGSVGGGLRGGTCDHAKSGLT